MAHKTARERAEKAESQVSMTKLDLKTTREEASRLQQEVSGLQQKVGRGGEEGGREGGREGSRPVCSLLLCVLQLQTLQTESRRRLQSEADGKRDQEKKVEELQVPLHHLLLYIDTSHVIIT